MNFEAEEFFPMSLLVLYNLFKYMHHFLDNFGIEKNDKEPYEEILDVFIKKHSANGFKFIFKLLNAFGLKKTMSQLRFKQLDKKEGAKQNTPDGFFKIKLKLMKDEIAGYYHNIYNFRKNIDGDDDENKVPVQDNAISTDDIDLNDITIKTFNNCVDFVGVDTGDYTKKNELYLVCFKIITIVVFIIVCFILSFIFSRKTIVMSVFLTIFILVIIKQIIVFLASFYNKLNCCQHLIHEQTFTEHKRIIIDTMATNKSVSPILKTFSFLIYMLFNRCDSFDVIIMAIVVYYIIWYSLDKDPIKDMVDNEGQTLKSFAMLVCLKSFIYSFTYLTILFVIKLTCVILALSSEDSFGFLIKKNARNFFILGDSLYNRCYKIINPTKNGDWLLQICKEILIFFSKQVIIPLVIVYFLVLFRFSLFLFEKLETFKGDKEESEESKAEFKKKFKTRYVKFLKVVAFITIFMLFTQFTLLSVYNTNPN